LIIAPQAFNREIDIDAVPKLAELDGALKKAVLSSLNAGAEK